MAIEDLTTYTEVDPDGPVEFYYEGEKVLETTTNGVKLYRKNTINVEYMQMLKEMMDEVQELTMVKNDWGTISDGLLGDKPKKEVEWFTDEDFLI